MKTEFLIALISMTLPVWLAGCGNHDPHAGHNHGPHGSAVAPAEITLSQAEMLQHKISLGSVKTHTLRPTFDAPARVAFDHESTAHVGTLVNGRVSKMNVHLGDTVAKGDVLFTLESPELGAAQNAFLKALDTEAAAAPALELAHNNAGVAQAEAEAKAAEAMLALAKNPAAVAQAQGELAAAQPELQRATVFLENGKKLAAEAEGALAASELKQREAAVQTAKAKVQSAEAVLVQAKAQQVRDIAAANAKADAAAAGLKAAQARQVKVLGEAQSALQTAQAAAATARNRLTLFGMDAAAIAALAKDRALTLHYTVHAPRAGTVVEREVTLGEITNPTQPHLLVIADLSQVWVLIEVPPARAKGLQVGHSVTLLNKQTNERTNADLAYVSPLVDPETRTVQARVTLKNADGRWRPGQFLSVQLPTGAAPVEGLAVPASAVQIVEGQATVYTFTGKTRTFKSKPITVGKPIRGMIPVLGGLRKSENVVIQGTFLLKAEFGKAGAGHDHSH